VLMQGVFHLIGSRLRRAWSAHQAVFCFLALSFGGLLFHVLLSPMYDRYLLPLAALLMLICVGHYPDMSVRVEQLTARGLLWLRGTSAMMALACLALMGMFSVAAVHDYLAWNRARWSLLTHLTQEAQIPAHLIDGGMEFNGLHLYSPYYQAQPGKSWWWVHDDAIRITFGEQPGHVPYLVDTYPRWLTGRQESVMALRRMPASGTSQPSH